MSKIMVASQEHIDAVEAVTGSPAIFLDSRVIIDKPEGK